METGFSGCTLNARCSLHFLSAEVVSALQVLRRQLSVDSPLFGFSQVFNRVTRVWGFWFLCSTKERTTVRGSRIRVDESLHKRLFYCCFFRHFCMSFN